MAYGLPILHALLSRAEAEGVLPPKTRRPTRALILAPTRELALQVSSHLNACLNEYSDVKIEQDDVAPVGKDAGKKGKGKGKQKAGKQKPAPSAQRGPPLVSVAAIVGGMSPQKQKRILERGVDVLVATPGRLWDILETVSVAYSLRDHGAHHTYRTNIWHKTSNLCSSSYWMRRTG